MALFRKIAFGLLLAAWTSGAALAAEPPVCAGRDLTADPALRPDYAAFADDLVNDQGLLWRIDKDGVAPSYLYGTIHSTQAEPAKRARTAESHLSQAKVLITELGGPFDAAARVDMSAGILHEALAVDDDTFAGSFSADDAERIDGYLSEHGYPKAMAHHLQLWFLAVATSLPACELAGQAAGLVDVDERLAADAKALGLPVIALETFQDQIAALKATPPKIAAAVLAATARQPQFEDDSYVTLLNLYERERPAEMLAIIAALPGFTENERRAELDFAHGLLVGRNEVMAERAAPYLASGGVFIAVGALHLPGKAGLIERLRALGYRVERSP